MLHSFFSLTICTNCADHDFEIPLFHFHRWKLIYFMNFTIFPVMPCSFQHLSFYNKIELFGDIINWGTVVQRQLSRVIFFKFIKCLKLHGMNSPRTLNLFCREIYICFILYLSLQMMRVIDLFPLYDKLLMRAI